MNRAVLVIDMLRGFLEPDFPLYIGDEPRHVISRIQRLVERELRRGAKLFFICDNHAPDDREFEMFPPHCIAGTVEAEIVPSLAAYPGEIIPKRRFSGFFDTDLDDKLKEMQADKLVICGVLTNICVLHTTADARNRDYAVEIPVDCVASPDEAAHRFALEHMEKVLGAKLIKPEVS